MISVGGSNSRTAARVGGWSLIAAAVAFMVVFSYLAARFNYPDVLDGAAADVLPNLLQLGDAGRAVWVIYAFLPLLLIPGAIGANAALRQFAPNAMRMAVVFGVVTAVSMLMGLARWPSVHWELARAYMEGAPDARVMIAAVFDGLNTYLGNFIGEFVGELSLNMFFLATAFALLRAGRKWAAYVGMAAGTIGLIAAFRNVTPAVSLAADANNVVLPLWLIALGVVTVAQRTPRPNY